ncbi:peptidyl-prolyl cis-trans isomerase [Guptibacillus algicola]|uniref:peptidyl-prolyl cis-trans isomerase n=1 Tax=Guptibacillus algicola TaxID=225844 RepID=UPI001CD8195D|nr:peptidyl-prolyl cis-trans isomerase [Alkalihalobacillus algicola]MCA0987928.1 peptidyl-prolyl cis-trans isomerase [Alkalihalobacillus algicola]
METIIPIKGKVTYPITLDASVWIFDDRKIELDEFLKFNRTSEENENDYIKAQSERFEQARTGIKPPINQSIKRFEKEKILKGSYVIPLEPFISNAEPLVEGNQVQLETNNGEHVILSIEEALNGFLGFALNGKPLKDDGPVHFYYGDGSNASSPYKNISGITII